MVGTETVRSGQRPRWVGWTLAAGLCVLAVAILVTLTRSPLRVVGTNGHAAELDIAQTGGGDPAHNPSVSVCQAGEFIPGGTTAIQLSLASDVGPRVRLVAFDGSRALTSGKKAAGWGGLSVVVPVKRVSKARDNARICLTVGPGQGFTRIRGQPGAPGFQATNNGRPLGGAMRFDYLRPGGGSWWSRASSVAHRLGLGRAWGGTWVAFLAIALMLGMVALAAWLTLRELSGFVDRSGGGRDGAGDSVVSAARKVPQAGCAEQAGVSRRLRILRRVPTAAWVCALIACLNGIGWSILTPVFQAPDEQDHYTYVERLVEAGRLPVVLPDTEYSPAVNAALIGLDTHAIGRHPTIGTISTQADQRRLETDLAGDPGRRGNGSAGVATAEPPLYYLLEAVPYLLGSGGNVLQRVELMRLFSSLFGALTALFAFLFVREALPRVRWAWTVGGLGVALAPLLGFMSGVVQPDVMIYAVSTALFYCLARAFRRGLRHVPRS